MKMRRSCTALRRQFHAARRQRMDHHAAAAAAAPSRLHRGMSPSTRAAAVRGGYLQQRPRPTHARRALMTPAAQQSTKKATSTTTATQQHRPPLSADRLHTDLALPYTFSKILVANRGEIACRIIRTCRTLGVRVVAVYSEADAQALHVMLADEAVCLGPAPAQESYLRIERIIQVAKQTGAQAIHPGYGFLSENVHFAEACSAANIEFIGPPVEAIRSMGSKSASKDIMLNAGVPCVPGYHGTDQNVELLTKEADAIGFPVMIKAVLGGGGKGMRIVHEPTDFLEALEACKREAQNSFGDDRVLIERYVGRPRHIEFQVFADKHGNCIHLHERDCSAQRRHQKVLEEAPAPGLSEALRHDMGEKAIAAARAVNYVGAGTVEFLFDADTQQYFFMEMNTRLQVEHPVTEMLTGRDLVQWQLHVAAGHTLPATQAEVSAMVYGHAMEARIYAEDPANNFLPATGRLDYIATPLEGAAAVHGEGVRVETGVRTGDDVSIYYDPMISKLVVCGATRESALAKMSRALSDYHIVGPPTNIPFLKRAVAHEEFVRGGIETNFIEKCLDDLVPQAPDGASSDLAFIAAVALIERQKRATSEAARILSLNGSNMDWHSPWNSASGLRLNASAVESSPMSAGSPGSDMRMIRFTEASGGEGEDHDGMSVYVSSSCDPAEGGGRGAVERYQLSTNEAGDMDNVWVSARVLSCTNDGPAFTLRVVLGEEVVKARVVFRESDGAVRVFASGDREAFFRLATVPRGAAGDVGTSAASAVAPMSGKIVSVPVSSGDTVQAGDALVIMEAMKMEHVVRAPADGVVEAVHCAEGSQVDGGVVLVTFASEEDAAADKA